MDSGITELALGATAVWRVTHLLNAEEGPWRLMARLRQWAMQTSWGNLLNCFYCLSVWTALPFAVAMGATWVVRLILWPALSGAAILLERATLPVQPNAPVAQWYVESDAPPVRRELP